MYFTGEVGDGARGELELVAVGARGQRQQRREHAARARHGARCGVPEPLQQVPHQREVEVRAETVTTICTFTSDLFFQNKVFSDDRSPLTVRGLGLLAWACPHTQHQCLGSLFSARLIQARAAPVWRQPCCCQLWFRVAVTDSVVRASRQTRRPRYRHRCHCS